MRIVYVAIMYVSASKTALQSLLLVWFSLLFILLVLPGVLFSIPEPLQCKSLRQV